VIGDMISPVKAAVGPGYGVLDARLSAAIHLRFGLPAVLPAPIKKAIKAADQACRPGWRRPADRRVFTGRGRPLLRTCSFRERYAADISQLMPGRPSQENLRSVRKTNI
jgi:hypothetical protein